MFYITEINGKVREIIDTSGKANKYGKPKQFKSPENALMWLSRKCGYHTTSKYEICDMETGNKVLVYDVKVNR